MPNGYVNEVEWNGTPYDFQDKRINDAEITDWNNKYTKPPSGIPSTDLSASLQNQIIPPLGTLTLSTSWTDNQDDTYSQSVSIQGITNNTIVNLLPNSTVIKALLADGVSELHVENTNGVLTAVAIGAAPTVQLVINYTTEEVFVV